MIHIKALVIGLAVVTIIEGIVYLMAQGLAYHPKYIAGGLALFIAYVIGRGILEDILY